MLGWEETGHLEVSGSVGVVEGTEEQGGGFWGLEEAAGVGGDGTAWWGPLRAEGAGMLSDEDLPRLILTGPGRQTQKGWCSHFIDGKTEVQRSPGLTPGHPGRRGSWGCQQLWEWG